MKLFCECGGKRFEFEIERSGGSLVVRSAGSVRRISLDEIGPSLFKMQINSSKQIVGIWKNDGAFSVLLNGFVYDSKVWDIRDAYSNSLGERAGETRSAQVSAPIPGLVRRVFVKSGASVSKNQPLLTLEAMKMENEIVSPIAGKVETISAQAGASVDKGQLLAIITP